MHTLPSPTEVTSPSGVPRPWAARAIRIMFSVVINSEILPIRGEMPPVTVFVTVEEAAVQMVLAAFQTPVRGGGGRGLGGDLEGSPLPTRELVGARTRGTVSDRGVSAPCIPDGSGRMGESRGYIRPFAVEVIREGAWSRRGFSDRNINDKKQSCAARFQFSGREAAQQTRL